MSSTQSIAPGGCVVLPKPPATTSTRFAPLYPLGIKVSADGKSGTLEGMLNRSYNATVKWANGEFTYTTRHFTGQASAEQKMTKAELADLLIAVQREMKTKPGRQPEFEKLARQIRAAIAQKPVAPAQDVSRIPTGITGPNAGAGVNASFWANLMPSIGGGEKKVIGSVQVHGAGFNDAPPKLDVKSFKVYEKGTHKLVATIAAPKMESSQPGFGVRQNYRVEIPLSKIDLTKEYTLVAEIGINGAAPQQVRSQFGAIDKAY